MLTAAVTATGEEQAPIHNQIGKAIVDACVRAGKEGRKFRVIIVIPAIPGFAGDLRDDAATGTRAIMDYQYKSINRGEHSIMGQIKKAGYDPSQYIFVFNLRSYDRLNTTPAMRRQEEESGVKYQDVQRAQADEIMFSGVHGAKGDSSSEGGYSSDEDDAARKEIADRRRRFEEKRETVGLRKDGHDNVISVDSIAHHAMKDGKKVSEEPWDPEDPDSEKANFVQEELYIHAKLLIVDDRIVICGSSNINDRSQLGYHDSELSIVMEDRNLIESKMDSQPYQAGHHAATLRRMLWREHLGLLDSQEFDASNDPNAQPPGDCPNDLKDDDPSYEFVADPLGDEVWDMWCGRADKNTEVFRDLFHADPDDNSEYSFLTTALSPRSHYSNPTFIADHQQSKTLTTTLASFHKQTPRTPIPSTSKGTSMTFIAVLVTSKRTSMRSRVIWYGCRWTSSRMRRWPRRVCK